MIKKLRFRFILIATLSLFLVMVLSFTSLIGVAYSEGSTEADKVLEILVKNDGHLVVEQAKDKLGDQYTREGLYKYRYFTVSVDVKKNKMQIVDDRHIITSSAKKTLEKQSRISDLLKDGKMGGAIRVNRARLRYSAKKIGPNNYLVCFLDIGPLMQTYSNLIKYALIFTFGGMTLFLIIMGTLSNKAIKPIKDAYDKQRRFITNAGHELKTPLAVISANNEMEELLGNEDEWTKSTKEQVVRMTSLIDNLIVLTRMSEPDEITLSKVNFSDIVQQSADSFKSVLAKDNKDYQVKIEKDLYVNAETKSLLELVNILIDNAQKYCDEYGKVMVVLAKGRLGQNAILTVTNTYADGKNIDTKKFFERFYREDESHHRDTKKNKKSGFGIGLSMAQDLVSTFGGKISADWQDGVMVFTVSLKLKK